MEEENFEEKLAELGIEEFDSEKIKDPKERKRYREFGFFSEKFGQKCKEIKQINYFRKQIEQIEDKNEREKKLGEIKKDIAKLDEELHGLAKEVLKRHTSDAKEAEKMLETIDFCWRCKRATRLPCEGDGKIICVEKCSRWNTLFDICMGLYAEEIQEPSYQEWTAKMIARKEREITDAMYR